MAILVLKLDCSGIVVGRRLLLSDPVVGVENVTWTEGKIYLNTYKSLLMCLG